ncbi:cysteine dioxygenase [Beijerinckia indica]|uniref:Cysteine dioxygenase type I n=1 Tax=Beijerinckia indica subsp. indica (strain ATCC 9039 / DSM 1715 / NCIMB 8712) TaxID=395963 RepID=B2IFK5_BEII9|nr:cysteine dioxygenase [Beijerinckia indica]ACB97101.1 cysteine dioxygenase type I [Beijerinckia indica subsp. indica ATCC 9039]
MSALSAPPQTEAALKIHAGATSDLRNDGAFDITPLREFVIAFSHLLDKRPDEAQIVAEGSALLQKLVSRDDWLPEAYAVPNPDRYQQFLLHADSGERFSIVSFVWGPGQSTPIHNHTVWGLIGMLRGGEYAQYYGLDASGVPTPQGDAVLLQPGQVEAVSPGIGDIHKVSNAHADQVSISIHIYGANIGAVHRSVYAENGQRKPFISGYSNKTLPNLWDLSAKA